MSCNLYGHPERRRMPDIESTVELKNDYVLGLLFTINSVQTRCIVKGEAQKSPLFWRFSGGFDFLRIACSLGIPQDNPSNLIKSPIFSNTPCKSTCLYNAPSMHTVVYEIFTKITLQDCVGWGIFTVIPGYPQRAVTAST